MERTDMPGTVAVIAERTGQRRNISSRAVFVVDNMVLPAVASRQQNRPVWRAQGMVREHVVTRHAFGCEAVQYGSPDDRVPTDVASSYRC